MTHSAAETPVGASENVLDSAALLAAAGDEAEAALALATDDDDVAAGNPEAAAVLVAPGLEGDVVVAAGERATADDDALT